MFEFLSQFAGGGLVEVFGGLFGLVGGYLAKRVALKIKQEDNRHAEKMADIAAKEAAAERTQALELADKNRELAETEGRLNVEERETDAFVESIKGSFTQTGIKFVDGIRGLIRPVLTVWLVYELHVLRKALETQLGPNPLTQQQAYSLYVQVITAIIFLVTTAVGWWFASRRGQI